MTVPQVGFEIDPKDSLQLITVVATSPSAKTAQVTAWQKNAKTGKWTAVWEPIKAYVGSDGIGKASEWVSRTPAGTFTLTEAFGKAPDPGTAMPYFVTDSKDWWVSDTSTRAAKYYNTHQRCLAASCPFSTSASEHLAGIWQYEYAVVIDYNRSPVVPGAGSAFFFHVTDGHPTAGCVAIQKSSLVSILKWLNPKQHPRMAIGVK